VEITVEPAGKAVVAGDGPTLRGSAADEILQPGTRPLTTVAGRGGADDIDLTEVLDDGSRQLVRVLDYGPDDRLVGLGVDDVLHAVELGQTTSLLIEGPDRDQILVSGASTLEDINFAEADVLVA
jgi:hypothetical protein